jgi:hypothetical protein
MTDTSTQPETPGRRAIPERLQALLRIWPECSTMAECARRLNVADSTLRMLHRRWYEKHEEYRRRFNDVEAAAVESIVAEARRRAVSGIKRRRFYRGEPIIDPDTGEPFTETEYSDSLLLALLKARAPGFSDRVSMEGNMQVSHTGQLTVQSVMEQMHNDPDYIEYLRVRAGEADRNSGPDGQESQPRALEGSSAPAGT